MSRGAIQDQFRWNGERHPPAAAVQASREEAEAWQSDANHRLDRGREWQCCGCTLRTFRTEEALDHARQSRREWPFDHILYDVPVGFQDSFSRATRRIIPGQHTEENGGTVWARVEVRRAKPADHAAERRATEAAEKPAKTAPTRKKKAPAKKKPARDLSGGSGSLL